MTNPFTSDYRNGESVCQQVGLHPMILKGMIRRGDDAMELDGKKVLVVRLSALGDVFRTVPAVLPLMTRFQRTSFTWLVENSSMGILSRIPGLDLIEMKREEVKSGSLSRVVREWKRVVRVVREGRFDVAIDYHGVMKSALLVKAAGIPVRVGYERGGSKEGSRWLLTHRFAMKDHRVSRYERNLALSSWIAGEELSPIYPDLSLSDEENDQATGCLTPPPLILFPGTSYFGRNKRWPAEYWAYVYRQTEAHHPVFAFGPQDDAIRHQLTSILGSEMRCLPRLPLVVFAAVLRKARGLVACDTGPLHLASILGTPTVALMGPSDPQLAAPLSQKHMVVPNVPCAPCRIRSCQVLICQTATTPSRIVKEVDLMLGPV
ncbi:MAG: glycosyltransferase family 9 protein [Acidobacteria bacterium]|nr:glycosyltransferase family 9 protein [Acidobacteriota bacterium]